MAESPTETAAPPIAIEAERPPAANRKRGLQLVVLGALLLVAIVLPFVLDDYLVRVGTTIAMLAVLAASWNLIGGYAGYPSFGNAVFFGLGAYGGAIAMLRLGLPFPAALLCGGLVSTALALLIGLPVLRLRGHYFAIATLGILSAMQQIVILGDKVTGGGAGLTLPLSPLSLETFDELIYLVMLAILVAVVVFTFVMARSRLGYGLVAIRENEVAARVMGVNTTLYKVTAFAICAFFSGLAGSTYGYWLSALDPYVAFDSSYNVLLVVIAIFGGAGTVAGPIVGAIILGGLSEWLRGVFVQYHLLGFGIVIVLVVIFAPRGLVDLWERRHNLTFASLLENIRSNSV
jgi:branched-chain amino acid transport system permease protein